MFVELYTDRIEIVSPGGLPKGMTVADLGRKSVRRNALIMTIPDRPRSSKQRYRLTRKGRAFLERLRGKA